MTVYKNDNQGDKSNIEWHDGKIIEYDKEKNSPTMRYIDYGISLFNKAVFSTLCENVYYDLTQVHKALLAHQQLAAFRVYQTFYEIGSIGGIMDLEKYLTNRSVLV
jgi:N-acetyl-alpha-D-muramate 1-phosphate uridylyltransferase